MIETNLIQTSASAMATQDIVVKRPRPFLVRLGIGVGTLIADSHEGFNEFLWEDTARSDLPDGIAIGFLGTIATGVVTFGICCIIAALSPYTLASLVWYWPTIVIGLLPAEVVGTNILINIVLSIPRAVGAIGRGISNGIKFIINGIIERMPNE